MYQTFKNCLSCQIFCMQLLNHEENVFLFLQKRKRHINRISYKEIWSSQGNFLVRLSSKRHCNSVKAVMVSRLRQWCRRFGLYMNPPGRRRKGSKCEEIKFSAHCKNQRKKMVTVRNRSKEKVRTTMVKIITYEYDAWSLTEAENCR